MAIEPISSAMTYQVQQTPMAKPVTKPEMADTEVALSESTVSFDPTTAKITESQEADTKGQEKGQNDQETTLDLNRAMTEKIKKALEELNKSMSNSEAVFGIHEETNHVTIKIVDKDTKKVIKELPAEKTLDMIAKVWEMAGILIDEKR